MREIVLDTETTGLRFNEGDRIIEIACVEIENLVPTGRELHYKINPEGKKIAQAAGEVHGIKDAELLDKPRFAEIIGELLEFIGEAPLVIHNADFDMGFLRGEFKLAGKIWRAAHPVKDTLALARQKFPGAPASLDALCKRFSIDLSVRERHTAIVDTRLLAAVYLELCGGSQASFIESDAGETKSSAPATAITASESAAESAPSRTAKRRVKPLASRLTAADTEKHSEFLKNLK